MTAVRIISVVVAVWLLTWALVYAGDDHGRPVPPPPVGTRSRLAHPSMRAPFTDDQLYAELDAWARAAGGRRLYDQEGEGL